MNTKALLAWCLSIASACMAQPLSFHDALVTLATTTCDTQHNQTVRELCSRIVVTCSHQDDAGNTMLMDEHESLSDAQHALVSTYVTQLLSLSLPDSVDCACTTLAEHVGILRSGGVPDEIRVTSNAIAHLVRKGNEQQQKRAQTAHDYLREKKRLKEEKIMRKQAERNSRAREHASRRHERMMAVNKKRERDRRNEAALLLRQKERAKKKEVERFRNHEKEKTAQKEAESQRNQANRNRIKDLLHKLK